MTPLIIFAIVCIVLLWKSNIVKNIFMLGMFIILIMSCSIASRVQLSEYVTGNEPSGTTGSATDYQGNIDGVYDIAQLMYKTTPSMTNSSGLHGIDGYKGYDFSLGCDTPIHAPFSGTITYSGLDGYNHVDENGKVWPQATMLTLKGDAGELTFLHSNLEIKSGDKVDYGQRIASEATIGWSTGCHSHVIWRPDDNYQAPDVIRVAEAKQGLARMSGGFVDTGSISAYDKYPTDATIVNRQAWGQIPDDLTGYVLIAALDCNRIGQTGTLETHSGVFDVLVFDCAGVEDGGAAWMVSGDYVVEVDYYTRMSHPEIIGTVGTLRLKE